MASTVVIQNLRKRYGNHQAVDGLSLEVEKGERLVVLGPNGAGKSTLIKMTLGLLKPDSGKIEVLGEPPHVRQTRYHMGCTLQDTSFPDHVTVAETIKFIAGHYPESQEPFEMLKKFGLEKLTERQNYQLSGGQKRCLALVCAFVGNPAFVILDEPTVGLDVEIRRHVWDEILAYSKRGGTLLLTTHHLEEAEELATRIAVVNRGQLVTTGTVEQIRQRFGFKRIRFRSPRTAFDTTLNLKCENGWWTAVTENPEELLRQILKYDEILDLEVTPVSLEEAFLGIVSTDEPPNVVAPSREQEVRA